MTLKGNPDVEKNVDIAAITSISDLEAWHEFLDTGGHEDYGTIVIDSLTDVSELALMETLESVHKDNPKRDRTKPDIEHWGRVKIIVQEVIRSFRDLPCKFIATALEREVKDDVSKRYVTPALSGQMAIQAGAYFNIIGRLASEEVDGKVVRRMTFQPVNGILAKDRSETLGVTMIDTTLPLVYETVLAGKRIVEAKVEPKIKMQKYEGKK
jgi:hypothetical protein